MKDTLIKAMACDGHVRIYMCSSTNLVEEARQRFDLWPTASAALGRTLTVASMMGSMLKNVTKSFYDVIAAKNNGETLNAEQRYGLSKQWVEMYFIDSMAQFLPEDVMTAIAQAEEGIVSGSVTVQEAAN